MKNQSQFNLDKGSRGGRRTNSGRKRLKSIGVAHRARELISLKTPLHINIKLAASLKNSKAMNAFKRSVINSGKFFHVLHYSIEANHIHLIAEAQNNESLEKGMRSFTNTLVKCLKKGSLQNERYHLHVLKTPTETKNAFYYVIRNHTHHSKEKVLIADEFNSLYTLDLKAISKALGITIKTGEIKDPIELDQPRSWLMRQVISELEKA